MEFFLSRDELTLNSVNVWKLINWDPVCYLWLDGCVERSTQEVFNYKCYVTKIKSNVFLGILYCIGCGDCFNSFHVGFTPRCFPRDILLWERKIIKGLQTWSIKWRLFRCQECHCDKFCCQQMRHIFVCRTGYTSGKLFDIVFNLHHVIRNSGK